MTTVVLDKTATHNSSAPSQPSFTYEPRPRSNQSFNLNLNDVRHSSTSTNPAAASPLVGYAPKNGTTLRLTARAALSGILTAHGWFGLQDIDDRSAMLDELVPLWTTALRTSEWQEFQDAADAWRATAEVLSDPELVARLSAPWDPSEEVDILRP